MKRPWVAPEIHFVSLDSAPPGVDAASLPEEELARISRQVKYYRVSEGFATREIAGEVLAVPVGEQTQRLNGMVTFSEAGAALWTLLEKRRTRDDLVVHLARAYGVPGEQVAGDVDEFLERALKRGLLVECE